MKLKYYLRGLGIGILITVIVLTIASFGEKKELTDEEIIARAEELGMVRQERSGSILDSFPDSSPEDVPDPEGSDVSGNEGQEDPAETLAPPAGAGSEGTAPEDSSDPAADQPQDTTRPMVSVEVGPGEYSDRISQKLLEAGLIDDAEAFNKYLVDSGIDDLIAVGNHQIPMGSSYQEIGRILSEESN